MSQDDRSSKKPQFAAVFEPTMHMMRAAALEPVYAEDFSVLQPRKHSFRFRTGSRKTTKKLRILN